MLVVREQRLRWEIWPSDRVPGAGRLAAGRGASPSVPCRVARAAALPGAPAGAALVDLCVTAPRESAVTQRGWNREIPASPHGVRMLPDNPQKEINATALQLSLHQQHLVIPSWKDDSGQRIFCLRIPSF